MDGDSAAISKDITDNDAGKNNAFLFLFPFHVMFLLCSLSSPPLSTFRDDNMLFFALFKPPEM